MTDRPTPQREPQRDPPAGEAGGPVKTQTVTVATVPPAPEPDAHFATDEERKLQQREHVRMVAQEDAARRKPGRIGKVK